MSGLGPAASGEPAWVDEVLRFWLEETPPDQRFKKDPVFDDEIASRFGALFETQSQDPPEAESLTPRSALAAIVVLDQFPRNLFRGSPRAFSTDNLAMALAKSATAAGLDQPLPLDARLFVYLPYEHSEDLADQDRAVELISTLGDAEWTRFALAHRDVIRRFGRFPHRNATLGRPSTAEEIMFLKQPGSSF